jgi:hypothetical protein
VEYSAERLQMDIPSEFKIILQQCATEEWYSKACEMLSNRTYNLRELERLRRELRAGRPLRANDLEQISDKTHFGESWKIPKTFVPEGLTKKEISLRRPDCGSSKAEDVKRWKAWRRSIVDRLFHELGSLDLTSIVLRCVHPECFGVYSPPLLCLLQVPIAEPVLHYLAYCDELDVWGQYFLAKRSVGETDRALWVFYELAYGPHADPKSRNEYQKAFRDDPWVQKRHADNLLGPFFRQYTPLKQAGFLLGIDDNLAGKIAGCEFENCLKSLVNDERDFKIWRENRQDLKGDLVDLIEHVAEQRAAEPRRRSLIRFDVVGIEQFMERAYKKRRSRK